MDRNGARKQKASEWAECGHGRRLRGKGGRWYRSPPRALRSAKETSGKSPDLRLSSGAGGVLFYPRNTVMRFFVLPHRCRCFGGMYQTKKSEKRMSGAIEPVGGVSGSKNVNGWMSYAMSPAWGEGGGAAPSANPQSPLQALLSSLGDILEAASAPYAASQGGSSSPTSQMGGVLQMLSSLMKGLAQMMGALQQAQQGDGQDDASGNGDGDWPQDQGFQPNPPAAGAASALPAQQWPATPSSNSDGSGGQSPGVGGVGPAGALPSQQQSPGVAQAGTSPEPLPPGSPSGSVSSFSTLPQQGALSQPQADQMATDVGHRLMQDLGLTKEQAAGLVGNLYHESGMNSNHAEGNRADPNNYGAPPADVNRGYGWPQWTGSYARPAFEQFAREHNLDPSSPEANYQYLVHDLKTAHSDVLQALKSTNTVSAAAESFRTNYEQPAGENAETFADRLNLADRVFSML